MWPNDEHVYYRGKTRKKKTTFAIVQTDERSEHVPICWSIEIASHSDSMLRASFAARYRKRRFVYTYTYVFMICQWWLLSIYYCYWMQKSLSMGNVDEVNGRYLQQKAFWSVLVCCYLGTHPYDSHTSQLFHFVYMNCFNHFAITGRRNCGDMIVINLIMFHKKAKEKPNNYSRCARLRREFNPTTMQNNNNDELRLFEWFIWQIGQHRMSNFKYTEKIVLLRTCIKLTCIHAGASFHM